jgi:hypothetical protein
MQITATPTGRRIPTAGDASQSAAGRIDERIGERHG